jgi:hypothetical protein
MVEKDSELLLILNSVWDHDVGCGPWSSPRSNMPVSGSLQLLIRNAPPTIQNVPNKPGLLYLHVMT